MPHNLGVAWCLLSRGRPLVPYFFTQAPRVNLSPSTCKGAPPPRLSVELESRPPRVFFFFFGTLGSAPPPKIRDGIRALLSKFELYRLLLLLRSSLHQREPIWL